MSPWSDGEIVAHLASRYGIELPLSLAAIPKGRAFNYLVQAATGRWLFKVYQPDVTTERVAAAGRLVQFLAERGYPVKPFRATVDGALAPAFAGRATVLVPFVDGRIIPTFTTDRAERLAELGRLCGRFHRLGTAFDGNVGEADAAVGGWDVARSLERFQRLAAAAADRGEGDVVRQVEVRLAILRRLGAELAASWQACPVGLTHGDFYAEHVVWDGRGSPWVIDVLGARYFLGWELMRTFFQSVPPVWELDDADAPWRAYLAGYRGEMDAPGEQLAAAFDLYLFQLTKSAYGLIPDAASAHDPAKHEALLAFGRWRTRTCKELAARRADWLARIRRSSR